MIDSASGIHAINWFHKHFQLLFTVRRKLIHWLKHITRLFSNNAPFVLATVWTIEGSSPEIPGSRLLVTADDHFGHLHSSHRQQLIIQQARQILAGNTAWLEKKYPLGDVAGSANGHCTVTFDKFTEGYRPGWPKQLRRAIRDGKPVILANHIQTGGRQPASSYEVIENTSVAIEDSTYIDALFSQNNGQQILVQTKDNGAKTFLQLIRISDLPIAVVGNSLVAHALIDQLLLLPVRIYWISDRPPPDKSDLLKLSPIALSDNAFNNLPAQTRVAIATSDHETDIRCCRLALNNDSLSYIGCLGSLKKAKIAKSRLSAMGICQSRLSTLTMPIGLDSITGKQPAIIAASIVAQLLSTSSVS